MSVERQNRNVLWASLFFEALRRGGVRDVFLAPGSRSAPLVAAAVRLGGLRCRTHFDERGAAFAALGCARATGRPAAVVTTSGTAAANLLPAVAEADADDAALIVLTADRPPELRACGANQTLDQVGLFGNRTRLFRDVPCPDPALADMYPLALAAEALAAARHGPVHLNWMFREPLAPVATGAGPLVLDPAVEDWLVGATPWRDTTAGAHAPVPAAVLDRIAAGLREARRPVLVAGNGCAAGLRAPLLELAARLGAPVLPDVGSGWRLDASPHVIGPYDACLDLPGFRQRMGWDFVLQFGGRLVSRSLETAVGSRGAPRVLVHGTPRNLDPAHTAAWQLCCDSVAFVEGLLERLPPGPVAEPGWCAAWRAAGAQAARLWAETLDGEALSEPAVARVVARHTPAGALLFIGNSMPVRDVQRFAAARDDGGPRVLVSRGTSGIDGGLSMTWGAAVGTGRPAVALLGDLAALHDCTALLPSAQGDARLTLVVVNNRGGGIFGFLPIAAHADLLDPWFRTPHEVKFEPLAAAFGWAYQRIETAGALSEAVAGADAAGGCRLLEVRTDPADNVALHRDLARRLGEALAGA